MSISLRSSGSPLSLTLAGIGASVAVSIFASTIGTTTTKQPAQAGLPALPVGDQRSALARGAEGFIENLGQWDGRALFLAQSLGVNTWVTENGVVYDFHQTDSPNTQRPAPDTLRAEKRRGHVVRMEFVEGLPSQAKGEGLLEGRYNYLRGNDPNKWVTQVPRYAEARSERIYDGIEARWYFDQGRPRYDLIVAPGADPNKIQMRFEGASRLSSNGKALRIGTSLGDVEHRGLFAYQKVEGATRQIPAAFRVNGNTASFEIGNYDRSRPLVIDPLIWGSYVGGGASENELKTSMDNNGKLVVAGSTTSVDFPVSIGAYDTTHNGNPDIFVAKLASDGSTLLFATYLGGTGEDVASALTVLPTGEPVLGGYTTSSNFPTAGPVPIGPYDSTFNGGTYDGYVAVVSSDGTALSYSSYFGGSSLDFVQSVDTDASSNLVFSGSTFSPNLPLVPTNPGFQMSYNTGQDGFVAKLATDGSGLIGSTYIGAVGSASNEDAIAVSALDNGSILVTGLTQATGFPTTVGAFDTTHNGGDDVYVVKFAQNLSVLEYGSYMGGTGSEYPSALYSTGSADIIIGGRTTSANFPVTFGAYDVSYAGGDDIFIAIINSTGGLVAATYLGGTLDDSLGGLSFDSLGNVIAVGSTFSPEFPTTVAAFDRFISGNADQFLCKLSLVLTRLSYSTLIGGSGADFGTGLYVDASNGAFLAGTSSASDYPITPGTFDQTFFGANEGTLAKFLTGPVMHSLQAPKNTFIGGFAIPFDLALNQPAEPGDVIIPITSDNPGKILTTSTKMRVGKQSKNLSVRTETVLVDTDVQITATYGGVAKTFNLTLKPGGLQSLKLQPTTLTSMQLGTGTVKISAAAPLEGRSVALSSSKSELLFVPDSVNITPGRTDAVFPTFAGIIASTTSVTVTAKLGTMQKTATLTLNP